jgi:hypothetical protein
MARSPDKRSGGTVGEDVKETHVGEATAGNQSLEFRVAVLEKTVEALMNIISQLTDCVQNVHRAAVGK